MLKDPEISQAVNMEEMAIEGGGEENQDGQLSTGNEDSGPDEGNQVAEVDVEDHSMEVAGGDHGAGAGGGEHRGGAGGGMSSGKSVRFAPAPTTQETDAENDMKST